MAEVTSWSDFGAQENKVCHCFHCFPIYLPWSNGTNSMILVFWTLRFKPTFSHSSFTFIKMLFSSSSLSAIGWCHLHIWGCWYFSLQSWFQLVLYPAWHFTWCILHRNWISKVTIYSLDVLVSQLEPVHCSIFGSNCCFLTCIQISQEAGQVVWYTHLFKNFPVCYDPHSQGFSIVNQAEIDAFL